MPFTNIGFRLMLICASSIWCAVGALAQSMGADAVIPVAGSLHGGFGSNYRTAAQLHNRTARGASGEIVFHPANVPASESDPRVAYDLGPHSTIVFNDVVASLGVEGLGSIDIVAFEGAIPAVIVGVYDDQEVGTNGTGVPLIDNRDALVAGDTASLIVPGDLFDFRFNLGIRSLSAGVTVRLTVWREDGTERSSVVRVYGADFFQQQPASEFVLGTVDANDSIAIEIVAGSAFLYGAMTDNITNDPAIQIAVLDEVTPPTTSRRPVRRD